MKNVLFLMAKPSKAEARHKWFSRWERKQTFELVKIQLGAGNGAIPPRTPPSP